MRDAELFGARIFPEIQFLQQFADPLRFCDLAEIVRKRFAFLPEAGLHKIQKIFRVADAGFPTGAGEPKCDQRRSNFWRRAKRTGREFEHELGPRVELGGDGKIAIVFVARLCGEAQSHFQLDDNLDFIDLVGEREETVEDRRSNVVGEIAVDADAPAGSERAQVGFEDVAWNDGEIRVLGGESLKPRDERRVELDRINRNAAADEIFGHFSMASANFNPAIILSSRICGNFHAVCGDAYRAGDFFAPAGVAQKVLSKFLSGHECVIRQSISSFRHRGRSSRLEGNFRVKREGWRCAESFVLLAIRYRLILRPTGTGHVE